VVEYKVIDIWLGTSFSYYVEEKEKGNVKKTKNILDLISIIIIPLYLRQTKCRFLLFIVKN